MWRCDPIAWMTPVRSGVTYGAGSHRHIQQLATAFKLRLTAFVTWQSLLVATDRQARSTVILHAARLRQFGQCHPADPLPHVQHQVPPTVSVTVAELAPLLPFQLFHHRN